jgi:hypothetical protein
LPNEASNICLAGGDSVRFTTTLGFILISSSAFTSSSVPDSTNFFDLAVGFFVAETGLLCGYFVSTFTISFARILRSILDLHWLFSIHSITDSSLSNYLDAVSKESLRLQVYGIGRERFLNS